MYSQATATAAKTAIVVATMLNTKEACFIIKLLSENLTEISPYR